MTNALEVFLRLPRPPLASADSSPGSCPSFDLGYRYLPIPLMALSLHERKRHYLNTLAIELTSPSLEAPPPAVQEYGYGAGLGLFFLHFPSLARWAGTRGTSVYVVDWLGMGRSARVPFSSPGEARRHPRPRARDRDILRRVARGVA